MRIDQQHAEVAQRPMPRLRQRQAPADAVALLVGSGDHIERKAISFALRAIGPTTARPSPADGKAGCLGKLWPRLAYDAVGRLVGEHAAIVRRRAQRAADVRAELERHVAAPPARRPSRPTSRPASARCRRDCWWCHRSDSCVCQSASATGTLVLPMITAPAAFSRWTGTASSVGRQSLKAGMPQVVGRPATLNDSFTVIGRPSNGRRSPRASGPGRQRSRLACPVEVTHHHGVDGFVERLDARDGLVEAARPTRRATGSEVSHELTGGAILARAWPSGRIPSSPRWRTPRQRQPRKRGGRPCRPPA